MKYPNFRKLWTGLLQDPKPRGQEFSGILLQRNVQRIRGVP